MYAFSFVYWAVVGMGVEGEVGVAAVSTLEVEGAYSTEGAIAVEWSTRFFVHSSAAHADCAVAANGFFGVVSAGSVVVVGLIGKVGVGRVFVNSWYMVGRSE